MVKEGMLAVLVAENNPAARAMICSRLEGLGVFPDAAANGREAVEASRNRVYDLIILACRMPVLDGAGAAREIRVNEEMRSRRPRIVGITGEAPPAGPRNAVPSGMDALIGSPYDEAVLADQIRLLSRDG
jgi:CheY-like chemotaxis protein